MNLRKKAAVVFCLCIFFLAAVCIGGSVLQDRAALTDFTRKNQIPSLQFFFGTDWMGRDMWARTLSGLSASIGIGLFSASISAFIALTLGILAAIGGRRVDHGISFLIDMILGVPHILLLILVSLALGKGFRGVVFGIALTHWPSLARVVRGEVLQVRQSRYVQTAYRLGHGRVKAAFVHIFPHILPQFITGFVLMFPHAILHEASITFLGFGLPSEQPAIGMILSESMQYLITGKWWLALFPGIMLVLTVFLFDRAGHAVKRLLDPKGARE